MISPLFRTLVLSVALAALVSPALAAGSKRITSASSVRVRSGPSTSASVVDTLSVGVLLDELGRSDTQQTIGGQKNFWYKVATPGGKTGWIFGGLTLPADPDHLDDAYLALAR